MLSSCTSSLFSTFLVITNCYLVFSFWLKFLQLKVYKINEKIVVILIRILQKFFFSYTFIYAWVNFVLKTYLQANVFFITKVFGTTSQSFIKKSNMVILIHWKGVRLERFLELLVLEKLLTMSISVLWNINAALIIF